MGDGEQEQELVGADVADAGGDSSTLPLAGTGVAPTDALANPPKKAPSRLLGWWTSRFLSSRRRKTWLEELLGEEDAAWKADAREVANLIRVMRSKHAESAERSKAEQTIGLLLMGGAISGFLVIVLLLVLGWFWLHGDGVSVPGPDGRHTVQWVILAASSGAILLLLGTITLAMNAATKFFDRARRYAEDGDETRRLEVAVRLVLIGVDRETRDPMQTVLARLMERRPSTNESDVALSAFEPAKAIADAAAKVAEAAVKVVTKK